MPEIEGVSQDWHNLSHHGQDPAKIEELKIIEVAEFRAFSEFLAKLKGVQEQGLPLLDNTAVLFGSNLGNASAHDTKKSSIAARRRWLPPTGRHLAVDPQKEVFSNLFVTMAQRMGVETDHFGFSTGVLDLNHE